MRALYRTAALAALGVAWGAALPAGGAQAAPFEAVSFKKGQSALVYDVGSVRREGAMAQAWVYQIVAHPMDGASMIATYREFSCALRRTRDMARRFVSPEGATLRAVETPGEWQDVAAGDERFDLMQKVCAGAPQRIAGRQMSVFDFQTVVREALTAGPR
ncbi:surface-adhesin E family protein [Phenylobacterium sp.]|uniref:surface-adhesin E family protein n=1 Tax=Phenylobacterium sp. TaxID=1871053 RepID=UPI00289DDE1A|nr:surface-adhesin E family protein [Phenylobacterium sp.]